MSILYVFGYDTDFKETRYRSSLLIRFVKLYGFSKANPDPCVGKAKLTAKLDGSRQNFVCAKDEKVNI